MKTNMCATCRKNQAEYDVESGGFFSWCSRCFWLLAAAPYCHHTDHHGNGAVRTVLVERGEVSKHEAHYTCPDGHGTATLAGWGLSAGTQAAKADMARRDAGGLNLVDVRVRNAKVDSDNPYSRSYARAYVSTVS